MANVPITSLPEATAPSANDYLILQGTNTQKIKWSALVNKLYPVGCIYQSTSSTSPASFLGGTWEQIKDRFILAAGDTYAAGSTGGEAEHTLTVNEMPKHNHVEQRLSADGYQVSILDSMHDGHYSGSTFKVSQSDWFSNKEAITTRENGFSQPHNNMPPYVAMYVWKRIA